MRERRSSRWGIEVHQSELAPPPPKLPPPPDPEESLELELESLLELELELEEEEKRRLLGGPELDEEEESSELDELLDSPWLPQRQLMRRAMPKKTTAAPKNPARMTGVEGAAEALAGGVLPAVFRAPPSGATMECAGPPVRSTIRLATRATAPS